MIEIILRTAIVYFVILVGIRLTGKREIGQMTPFDLALLLLISNAVQNAMTGPDTSVSGGIVAAGTLLLLNAAVNQIVWRNKKVRKLVEGSPTLLIRHGKILKQNLEVEKLTVESLTQALREHGVASVSDVSVAVLEIDGSISVLKNDEVPPTDRPHRHFRFIGRKNN
ncbi:MAG TPA: YetF domain-containing protein [Bacteroidota bacterium]|nr:YetF domain-containing protein [Bacteroidota bacterium]